jgi:hypothetical protein
MNNTPDLPGDEAPDVSIQQHIGNNSGNAVGEGRDIYQNCNITNFYNEDRGIKDKHFQFSDSSDLEKSASSESKSDGHRNFDVFVSHIDKGEDKSWVESEFIPALEKRGVRIISSKDFSLGVPRLENIEKAIENSSYVIAVVSKGYIQDGFANFENVLAQHYGCEKQQYPLVLVLRDDSKPRLRLQPITPLDMSDEANFSENIDRLVRNISSRLGNDISDRNP